MTSHLACTIVHEHRCAGVCGIGREKNDDIARSREEKENR